jgi:hypothetical protein
MSGTWPNRARWCRENDAKQPRRGLGFFSKKRVRVCQCRDGLSASGFCCGWRCDVIRPVASWLMGNMACAEAEHFLTGDG